MIDFKKLVGYRFGLRPVQPESLPHHIDTELQRISRVTGDIVAAIQELNDRLAALEP